MAWRVQGSHEPSVFAREGNPAHRQHSQGTGNVWTQICGKYYLELEHGTPLTYFGTTQGLTDLQTKNNFK